MGMRMGYLILISCDSANHENMGVLDCAVCQNPKIELSRIYARSWCFCSCGTLKT